MSAAVDRTGYSYCRGREPLGPLLLCRLFCQITSGKPLPLDRDEPRRVAESVRTMGLRYATITGVTRDDLPDTGAWLYAETIRQIHTLNPSSGVEVLADDLGGRPDDLATVFEALPEVFAHNLETVPRIFREIRPGFRFDRSLDVLRQAHRAGMITKSNLILGMGETTQEVIATMHALRETGCDILTLTQYLRPSPLYRPVDRWVRPQEFAELKAEADQMGFAGVLAGPLVRSSYRAGRLWAQAMTAQGRDVPPALRHLATATAEEAFPRAI
ncbi:Lipoyl synthase [Streptomyces sp. enrichment culture]